jgi:hypothetical protein
MLFGDYIKVEKNRDNKWDIKEKFKRYHSTDIYRPLFDKLLNISDCFEAPDLTSIVDKMNEYIKQNMNLIVREANDIEILNDLALKKRK